MVQINQPAAWTGCAPFAALHVSECFPSPYKQTHNKQTCSLLPPTSTCRGVRPFFERFPPFFIRPRRLDLPSSRRLECSNQWPYMSLITLLSAAGHDALSLFLLFLLVLSGRQGRSLFRFSACNIRFCGKTWHYHWRLIFRQMLIDLVLTNLMLKTRWSLSEC